MAHDQHIGILIDMCRTEKDRVEIPSGWNNGGDKNRQGRGPAISQWGNSCGMEV
jgi:hypothetical protein